MSGSHLNRYHLHIDSNTNELDVFETIGIWPFRTVATTAMGELSVLGEVLRWGTHVGLPGPEYSRVSSGQWRRGPVYEGVRHQFYPGKTPDGRSALQPAF